MQVELPRGHSIAEESLRRASSMETGLTLPESRSSMRRVISSSQAALTDSSSASSRLSIKEPASSARSATGRVRAFFRRSFASLPIIGIIPRKSYDTGGMQPCICQLGRLFGKEDSPQAHPAAVVEIHHLLRENHRFPKVSCEAPADIFSTTYCKQLAYIIFDRRPSLAPVLQSSKTSVSTSGP